MINIQNFDDFTAALAGAGFSMGGGNDNGVFSIISWDWNEPPPYDTPVRWHTGDPDTDPWEWRMRVLEERDDVAYAKLFFKKSGYITKEWYPYFLAARRGGRSLTDAYYDGDISNCAKRIYDVISENGALPVHTLKRFAGFSKADGSKVESALTELQMKLYITMCGRQQKLSRQGLEYGWHSNVLCRIEDFWNAEVFEEAAEIDKDDAVHSITEQILKLNPMAEERMIVKFITGM